MTVTLLDHLAPTAALRNREHGGHLRVTNMELFFDLVCLFSIIQLSHFLLEHQSWIDAVEVITIFAAVWWAWNYTAWATTWIDPDHTALFDDCADGLCGSDGGGESL